MSLFGFQHKNEHLQHYCDIEELLFLNIQRYDENDFIPIDTCMIEMLGFTGDIENMLFIIESMERVVKGSSTSDTCCNFVVFKDQMFLKKKIFQHFVIISDPPKVRDYLIHSNRIIRGSFSLKYSSSPDEEYTIKELSEQNYRKLMKSFEERDDLIDLMETVYSYIKRNNKDTPIECIYCYISNEIRRDFKRLEDQLCILNSAFDSLTSVYK